MKVFWSSLQETDLFLWVEFHHGILYKREMSLEVPKLSPTICTYREFVNDERTGRDIIVVGHLVGDSPGDGVVLHSLVIFSSMFRYVKVGHQ